MNIEANHATLAQHTFQHELRVARDNGVFGSIDANQGDPLLGWDTDQFPTNVYDAALCMYEVLKAGGFTNGGLNFDSKARRGSFTPEDIFLSYIAGMDTFALGLRIAVKMIEDGRIDKFVADRYASWQIGIGKDIIEGNVTMADLEKYALEKSEVTDSLSSGKQEMLESVVLVQLFSKMLARFSMRSPGRPPQRAKFPALCFLRAEKKGEKSGSFSRGKRTRPLSPCYIFTVSFQRMIYNIRKEYIYGIYNRCGLRYKRYKDSSF